MTKLSVCAFTTLFLAVCLLGLGVGQSVAADKPIVLKAVNINPPTHPYHLGFEILKAELEKKSNGRLQLELFHSGQLGNERETIEQVILGSVDLVVTASAPWANFVSDLMVFDLPFIFRDRPHAYKVLDGPIGQSVSKGIGKEGLIFLGFWENGFRHVSNSKREVHVPADLKGMKIRLMENPIHLDTFKALGALPMPMAWTEVFTALQQGTIDAIENSPIIYTSNNLNEVQKYLSLTGHFYSPAVFVMNERSFNRVPEDLQKLILQVAEETKHKHRKIHEDSDDVNIEILKQKGMIITEVDKQPYIDAVMPLYQEYGKKLKVEEILKQIIETK